MITFIKSPMLRQYAVVVVVNLCLLIAGLGLTWPSPVLVKLRDENETVLDRPITEDEGSWIVSIGFLISIPGKHAEAVKVLTFLRGSEALANEEMKEYELNKPEVGTRRRDLLKKKPFLRALGIVCVIGIGMLLVGHNAINMYLQTVLESTNTSVPPEIASVVIGVIQLTSAVCSSMVTDKFGRKVILIVTLIGMMFGMAGLGAFFKIQETNDEMSGIINFLPLASLILEVFCYSAGLGSVNWVLTAELFDGQSRAFGLALGSVLLTTLTFLAMRYFATLVSAVGPAPSYWLFSVNCLLLCLFVIFCVPETKGKTFSEIQVALGDTPDYAYGEELPPVKKEETKEK